ncbi:MAG: TIGR00725 family protein [candidate division KSB1 bacterium]|nr:TIGR00725 family protein [candidate division KSB1 bacterium]MDZ7301601.1 TIGR00725 family protein [candidate division KSB1 bacterium]MDZ7310983.1 TIGR00725 family protein [candidate division KSB1 bacterium]
MIIAVIGGSHCSEEIYELARQVGHEIARAGAILICGGMFGVMEAACRGAKEAGGTTIGILPGKAKTEGNAFVDIPIVTGLSDARNVIIARSADGVIAVDGEYGTLSEIAFALKFGKPVVGLKVVFTLPHVTQVVTAAEAVKQILSRIGTI